jgi:hypothetical protein
MGGRVWVDRRILLRHAGHFNFSQESHNHLLNSFGPMYVEQMKAEGKMAVQMLDGNGNVIS